MIGNDCNVMNMNLCFNLLDFHKKYIKIFSNIDISGKCFAFFNEVRLHLEITLSSLVSKKGPWKLVEQVVKGANFL